MDKIKSAAIYLGIIGFVAFTIQYAWEYAQCGYFYTVGSSLEDHTRLMLSATFGDMMMSLMLYLLLVFVNNDIKWIKRRWKRHDLVIMILYALFLSFYFEINALHTGRWGYNPNTMPIIPDTPIALVPVIQLLVLLPLIFLMTKKIIKSYKL